MNKPLILIVDSNRSSLEALAQQLGQLNYDTVGAASLDELDQFIQSNKQCALAVIDLSSFAKEIWERIDRLHEAKISFIIVAPQRSPTIQRDSMKYGASGLLVKPLALKELIEHIHSVIGD
ncbi:MAG TPA: response regulator [Dehalococcoidales bacterium]|nr:MAG: hypothetical protein A2Z05_05665 [Chloroflexi bacterium RBG_16_60_22]HJX12552.1 response regulator [Dehalococcoidales bacterium]